MRPSALSSDDDDGRAGERVGYFVGSLVGYWVGERPSSSSSPVSRERVGDLVGERDGDGSVGNSNEGMFEGTALGVEGPDGAIVGPRCVGTETGI